MELLILLAERRGALVSREEIAERLWGKEAFLDVEHGINTAVRKIRRVLRDDPEKPRFVETVIGKGYRFAATITITDEVAPDPQQVIAPSPEQLTSTAPPPQQASTVALAAKPGVPRRGILLLGATALVVLVAVGFVITRRPRPHIQPIVIKSVAVLPFKNLSGDPAQEYLADGMTEALIERLSMISGLRVISGTSVMQFKQTHLPLPEIARELNADALVEGSVTRERDRIHVHAELLRGADQERLWSEEYDRDLRSALHLQSEMARSVAQRVEANVTGQEEARLVAARYVSPEAYESYLKGRSHKANTKADIEASIADYEEAIRQDATFAPAFVALAEAYQGLGLVFIGTPPAEVRPKAINAARKALELDPNLAEAHVLLGDVYQKEWRWQDAEAEYKQALELNPNDAGAHLLFADWLTCQGKTEEAIQWAQRARELDPMGVTGGEIGQTLFFARHYDEAIRESRSVPEVHPDYPTAQWTLGFALIANHQPSEAIAPLKKALSLTGNSPGVMGTLVEAYAASGDRTEALRLLDQLKQQQRRGYVPAAAFVHAYLGLGDRNEVFVWLDRAFQEQSNLLQYLRVHPFLDPIRDDPRFTRLLHRVGLDQPQPTDAPIAAVNVPAR